MSPSAVRVCFFFFSSRRRHTRYIGDWSSDVCSSDLPGALHGPEGGDTPNQGPPASWGPASSWPRASGGAARSEERRVGKEGRARGWRQRQKKKTNVAILAT